MAILRRLVAAALAIVVMSFPLVLERCRTACVSAATPAAASAPGPHACHDMAAEDEGPTATPAPLACSHGDEARLSEAAGLAPSKLWSKLQIAAPPAMPAIHVADAIQDSGPPPAVLDSQPIHVSRNLPLRL